jgi:hypothetical protein
MGFSQGGNVVDTYLHYHEHSNIKKAVILTSYSLNDPERNIVDDVSVLNLIRINIYIFIIIEVIEINTDDYMSNMPYMREILNLLNYLKLNLFKKNYKSTLDTLDTLDTIDTLDTLDTCDTLYQIACCSKFRTSIIVAKLYELGKLDKLDYDTDINKY